MWRDTWAVGDRTAELETIVVSPKWRGKGIGTQLMDRVELELQRLDIKDVLIGAVPTNLEVLELYQRRGFQPTWLVLTRFAKRRSDEVY
jgi:ribosomal protein S18 acetylase RimI-like enzyme